MEHFIRTQMGQRLVEQTLPRIATELGRLNQNLEALVGEVRRLASTSVRPQDGARADVDQDQQRR